MRFSPVIAFGLLLTTALTPAPNAWAAAGCINLTNEAQPSAYGQHLYPRYRPDGSLSLADSSQGSEAVKDQNGYSRRGSSALFTSAHGMTFNGTEIERGSNESGAPHFVLKAERYGYPSGAGFSDDERRFVAFLPKHLAIVDLPSGKSRYLPVSFPKTFRPGIFEFSPDKQSVIWETRDAQASPPAVVLSRLSLVTGKIETSEFRTEAQTDWSSGAPAVRELLSDIKEKKLRVSALTASGWKKQEYSLPSNATGARLSRDGKTIFYVTKDGEAFQRPAIGDNPKQLAVKSKPVTEVIPFPSGKGFWYQKAPSTWIAVQGDGSEKILGEGRAEAHPFLDQLALVGEKYPNRLSIHRVPFCTDRTYRFEDPQNCPTCAKSGDALVAVGMGQSGSPAKLGKQLVSRSLCSLSIQDPAWKRETYPDPNEPITLERARKVLWRLQKTGGYERTRDLPFLLDLIASKQVSAVWGELYEVLPNLYASDAEAYGHLMKELLDRHRSLLEKSEALGARASREAACRTPDEDRVVARAVSNCGKKYSNGWDSVECVPMAPLIRYLPPVELEPVIEAGANQLVDLYLATEDLAGVDQKVLFPIARASVRASLGFPSQSVAAVHLSPSGDSVWPIVISSRPVTFSAGDAAKPSSGDEPGMPVTRLAPLSWEKSSEGMSEIQSEYRMWIGGAPHVLKVKAKRKSLANLVPKIDRIDYGSLRKGGVRTGVLVIEDPKVSGEYIEYLVDQGYRYDAAKTKSINPSEWLKEKIKNGDVGFVVIDFNSDPYEGGFRFYEKDLGNGKKDVIAIADWSVRDWNQQGGNIASSLVDSDTFKELMAERKKSGNRPLFLFQQHRGDIAPAMEHITSATNPALAVIALDTTAMGTFINYPSLPSDQQDMSKRGLNYSLFSAFLKEQPLKEVEKKTLQPAFKDQGDADSAFLAPWSPRYYEKLVRNRETFESSYTLHRLGEK